MGRKQLLGFSNLPPFWLKDFRDSSHDVFALIRSFRALCPDSHSHTHTHSIHVVFLRT